MKSWRLYAAEMVGTAALLCAVIGSGIMAENLSGGNVAVALLANTLATVFALYVLIETIGPISGAHFNPAVSWVMAWRKELPILQWSAHVRTGPSQWLAEAVATAGLLFVIWRSPPGKASALVACYIGAAYWFTASTSFANPAAVFGRMLSDTFAGIAPSDAPGFVASQLVGAALGWLLHHVLSPPSHPS